MALKSDFLIKGVDFCQMRSKVYVAYRDLVFQDNVLKKANKANKFRAKLDKTEQPLRLLLLTEDETRAEVVDKPVEKYAKKLRMKYRVVREDVKRKKAKALKADENADVTSLDALLETTLAEHEKLVEAKRAELEALFQENWNNRAINEEEIRSELEALVAGNAQFYDENLVKLDQEFEKKNANYSKITDLRVKFWSKIEGVFADLIAKQNAKAGKKDLEPLPEDVILRARDLSMHFGGLKAVEALDFDVKKGEIFGLIGPNGAGKTTVFNCITQFYKPTRGDLHFVTKEGKTISLTDYKVHDVILKGIARTFQNVEVVKEVTVLENMLIAATRQYSSGLFTQMFHLPLLKKEERIIRAKADQVLQYMGLSLYRDRLAWGLPYGILKRIEIARVLMCNPQLIILDEPAAGLNDTETVELAALIRKIRDDFDCTVLLVEHDMGLVMDVCDHICAISFGRKLAYGTPEEVQASKEVQEAYLGTGGND